MSQLYKLYPTSFDADFQPTDAWFSKYIRILPLTDSVSFSETLTSGQVRQGYVFSYPDEIGIRTAAGPIVARINVTVANSNINWRIRAHRVSKYGYIQESTPWSAYRALSATGIYCQATGNVDWRLQAAPDDRLRIDYYFTTAAASAAFTFQLGEATPVDVPFSTIKMKYYDNTTGQWKRIHYINYWQDSEWKRSGSAYHWSGNSWVRFYLRDVDQ